MKRSKLMKLILAGALVLLSGTGVLDSSLAFAEDQAVPAVDEGLLPVPDYSGDFWKRSHLTGDWGGLRQDWANRGIMLEFDWYQSYQDIVNGGIREDSASSTNLDYRIMIDLMRMGLVPGALLTFRAQSRFGDTVNDSSGVLLPVNMYSALPFGDGDIGFTITELNWTQFLSEKFGLLAGKITTTKTANEFMGGEGRSQFMNFQFSFSATVANLAPYSTLAAGILWMPSPKWSLSTIFMNLTDASTTTGFSDIGDGTTWATTADYLGSLNDLPGGGSFGFYYGFDAEFARIGGLNIDPGTGAVSIDSKSEAWAFNWSGWQYFYVEKGSGDGVDPGNGRQDLQGLGVFAQISFADEDTNPVSWAITGGLSGRGSIPGRDADTWGVGYFYNDLQDLNLGPLVFESSVSGLEVYYDIAFTGWAFLTLDAQWIKSAFPSVDEATILGVRLNVGI